MSSVTIHPSAGGRPQRADSIARPVQANFSALDFWALFLPAISFVEITIVGRLIVTEVLMLAILPWLWTARDRLSTPRWIVALWAGWLIGQILTDIVVESSFEDYARGWAAIAFTFTNLVAILALASTPRRARLFAVGIAISGVLGYFFIPNPYAATDPWKWAFALPVGLALAAGLSGRLGARWPWLTVSALGTLAALNLLLGFRSLGGVCLLTAGYLAISSVSGHRQPTGRRSLTRAAIGLAILVAAIVGTLQLYDAAASRGLLGIDAQTKYFEQSGGLGVLVGGRSEVLASSQAIIDSPILGHGSWAKDFAYVDLLAEQRSSLGYEIGAGYSDVGLIPAHSYLLGSWVWAGILGGLFWIAVVILAVWLLTNLYAFQIELAPLIVFSGMLLLWNVAFSPYGFSGRIMAPYGIVVCLLGLRLLGRYVQGRDTPAAPVEKAADASTHRRSAFPTDAAVADTRRA